MDDFVGSFRHDINDKPIRSLDVVGILNEEEAPFGFQQTQLDGSPRHNEAQHQLLLNGTLMEGIFPNLANFGTDKDLPTGTGFHLNDPVTVRFGSEVDFSQLERSNNLKQQHVKQRER